MHLFLLLAMMMQPPKTEARAYTITNVPPLIVPLSKVSRGHSYVADMQGIIRTCPDGVGVYVRVETLHSDEAFHYLLPPTLITETKDR